MLWAGPNFVMVSVQDLDAAVISCDRRFPRKILDFRPGSVIVADITGSEPNDCFRRRISYEIMVSHDRPLAFACWSLIGDGHDEFIQFQRDEHRRYVVDLV